MGNWFEKNYRTLIISAFLIPIITVAVVSISHVTKWYGISNPVTWAIYLSIGIEIAALSALAAISANMGKKVYFPFGIVTLVQFIGNIFFAYSYIDTTSPSFISWVELVSPLMELVGVEPTDLISHKRYLALFAGGMLPLISLSFLHMLVKFTQGEKQISPKEPINENIGEKDDIKEEPIPASDIVAEVSRFRPTDDDLKNLEDFLVKLRPETPKKHPTKEEQREILTQMMRESEEMGLYGEPVDNPLIKENNAPQNASEMMITNDEDIINSIPSDDEMSDWDLTPEPPTWMDEIPEPTPKPTIDEEVLDRIKELYEEREDYGQEPIEDIPQMENYYDGEINDEGSDIYTEDDLSDWDVTLMDGLEDLPYGFEYTEELDNALKTIENVNEEVVETPIPTIEITPQPTPELTFEINETPVPTPELTMEVVVEPTPEPTEEPILIDIVLPDMVVQTPFETQETPIVTQEELPEEEEKKNLEEFLPSPTLQNDGLEKEMDSIDPSDPIYWENVDSSESEDPNNGTPLRKTTSRNVGNTQRRRFR